MKQAVIGVDIGGTNTVIGVFDEASNGNGTSRLLTKRTIPTLKPDFPNKTSHPAIFFDALTRAIEQLAEEAGYAGRISKVGAGVPGRVDPIQGMALGASNLGWVNVPFSDEMSRRLGGTPVYIDNDVRIYTLGEAIAGAGRGFANLIGLTLGTGIAASLFVDGRMVRGSSFYAGEIGHDTVAGEHSPCNCGKRGCLETIASASGIARLAKEAVASGKDTCLRDLEQPITSYDVYQACLKGDSFAQQLFRDVGTTLAHKLMTAIFLLNPEVIIIGGGAASAGEFLLAPIRETIEAQYPALLKRPQVCLGELGDSAGLIGAAAFATRQSEFI
ncbi:ROK family protein [Paenibacillus cremeus]|nr:ROK family protein [Paenibacillus cremeus]